MTQPIGKHDELMDGGREEGGRMVVAAEGTKNQRIEKLEFPISLWNSILTILGLNVISTRWVS